MSENDDQALYAILPLRNIVVFPHMIVPLFAGREKSVRALDDVMKNDKEIVVIAQRSEDVDNPTPDELFQIGTLASVLQLLKLPDGTIKVLVEATRRVQVEEFVDNENFMQARITILQDEFEQGEEPKQNDELQALSRSVVSHFEDYAKLDKKIPSDVLGNLASIEDPSTLADTIAQHLTIKLPEKQQLLETVSLTARLEAIYTLMHAEISVMNTEKRIRGRVKRQMEKTQREYYLNEQMKAIQKELGSNADGQSDLEELETRITKTRMSKEAKEKARAELKKLAQMSAMSAEATVIRSYLDWMLSIPWQKPSRVKNDLTKAEVILNEDHYGLEKVKERILEYLAVLTRVKKIRGSILCLVGPPGVGKTSLGRSIARATGRGFVRMSLGGVRDESEIRGHRRTYIGSMPGRIVQGMKKAKYSNPVFLLDEVDKLGADWRGDPSSALLEVLDPEQNSSFNDHYLEVDYDLSDVLFIATANSINMPKPLLDRMEIIHVSGYTEDEKIEIAQRHLLKKQTDFHGLLNEELTIGKHVLRDLIRYYTREAGVRNLERSIANLSRKAVRKLVSGDIKKVQINTKNLPDYAGVRRFKYGMIEEQNEIGVVTGLAWTEAGGDLLSIESVLVPGKGLVTQTGKLGTVMQESIKAAEKFVKSRAAAFGIERKILQKHDIHIHVPEGATPKDGPSAGVGMVTSMVSSLTGIAVRREVAMTGEITLRGRVLPIGGLKEKLLAALRGGITTVLIPKDNEKDLKELPDKIKKSLDLVLVSNADDVLERALETKIVPIEWDEDDEQDVVATISADDSHDDDAERMIKH